MLNSLLATLARWTLGGKIISAIGWAHDKLDGHRSDIVLGILALVHGLKLVNVIPADTAGATEAALLAILPVTLADKASKIAATIDKAVPSQEAPKP